MKKGIAVPYIIAIMLGVAVIGFIGYWLFISSGKFGTGAASQQCKTDFIKACQEWASTGYTSPADRPDYKGVFLADSDCEAALVKATGTGGARIKADYKKACG